MIKVQEDDKGKTLKKGAVPRFLGMSSIDTCAALSNMGESVYSNALINVFERKKRCLQICRIAFCRVRSLSYISLIDCADMPHSREHFFNEMHFIWLEVVA